MPTEPLLNTTLVAIRTAHHAEATPSYDRVVFEFTTSMPLMRVEYVSTLISDGSGFPVTIAGRAVLLVQFTTAQAHTAAGQATMPERIKTTLPMVKEIVLAGDFEAVVTYGIGLRRRAVTRMITLENPYRVVIDCIE